MSKRIPTTHPMSKLRHKKGLTLRDVKDATGISVGTLSRIEQWTQFPARGSMLSLIEYYSGALCANDFFPEGAASALAVATVDENAPTKPDPEQPEISTIRCSKQPRRPHYIAEWAEAQELTQADLARELGADKSVVSRWFNGTTPGVEWQERLAALFHCEPESLFRHPDETVKTKPTAIKHSLDCEKLSELREQIEEVADLLHGLDKIGDGIGGADGYAVSAVALNAKSVADSALDMIRAMAHSFAGVEPPPSEARARC
ncbi:MAG: helix-turn-helix domain-containing protein [Shinella sp.]|jgi:transcriptional regulator with XRE-family HTH domain|nr:helix-turn-helix domain-containing protein [Shinella sp.]